MNVNVLPETEAFTAGSEIWVIENDTKLKWWHEIDFKTCFLLTNNIDTKKQRRPDALAKILDATHLQIPEVRASDKTTLIGSSAHLLNQWLFLWQDLSAQELATTLIELSIRMQFKNIRIFSNSSQIVSQLKTRPTASSLTITYIENT